MDHLKIKESCFSVFIYIAVISGVILTEHLAVALQSCSDGNPLNVNEVPDEVVQPSNIKGVFEGGDVQLSCNYTNNVTWWFNGIHLHNDTSIKADKLILNICNVTIKKQGIYWCGSSWQHGQNVSVIIGNIPSEPQNIHTTSFDWDSTLHWTASLHTGDLPTHYTVTEQCIYIVNDTQDSLICPEYGYKKHVFKTNIAHVSKKVYNCQLLGFDLYQPFNVCVIAVNQLGNSSICMNFTRPNERKPSTTVPCPPPNFTAQELAVREVTLSWEQRSTWDGFQSYQIVILLSYSKRGDFKNTTVAEPIPAVYGGYVLKNLHPDSVYTFYSQAQYRQYGFKSSVLSSPAVVTWNTTYGAPSQPPVNLQCNASYSDGKRIVTLWWKPPEKKNWNGPLSTYLIHVSITAGNVHKSLNRTVNASLTTAAFIDVDNSDNIEMSVQACNINNSKKTLNIAIGYLCSGIGGTCTVSGDVKSKSKTQPPSLTMESIIGIVSAVVVLVVVVVVVGVILCICHRRNKIPEINPSLPVIDDQDYVSPQYEDVSGTITTEEYTRVNRNMDEIPLINQA